MLFFEDRQQFATGLATYLYQPATENETTPRICIRVSFEGVPTLAMVDTGAPYTILNPQIAEKIGLDLQSGILFDKLYFRNDFFGGYLHRLQIQFIAEEGEGVLVEATVFVPKLEPYQERTNFPSLIGLNSCLERLRFAIDPSADHFYFGALP
ncbi:MAG: retropepsin-like aspartic protease [Flexilinea sp.]